MSFAASVLVDYFMASLIVASMVCIAHFFYLERGERGGGMFSVLHGWHDGSSHNER